MIKYYYIFLFFSSLSTVYSQDQNWSEKDYSDYIQSLIGGEREFHVKGGRIDLLTNEFAFEIEWANNWKESIGQSMWYALNSNKKPAIILLLKKKEDYKFFIQLNTALEYAKIDSLISVYLFPNDFKELINKQKRKILYS